MKLSSSWIRDIRYRHTPDGERYLAIFTHEDTALLWKGSIPSHLPGLIQAGTGGLSIGHAFHKLRGMLNGCEYQRIEGVEKVNELQTMMKRR